MTAFKIIVCQDVGRFMYVIILQLAAIIRKSRNCFLPRYFIGQCGESIPTISDGAVLFLQAQCYFLNMTKLLLVTIHRLFKRRREIHCNRRMFILCRHAQRVINIAETVVASGTFPTNASRCRLSERAW